MIIAPSGVAHGIVVPMLLVLTCVDRSANLFCMKSSVFASPVARAPGHFHRGGSGLEAQGRPVS